LPRSSSTFTATSPLSPAANGALTVPARWFRGIDAKAHRAAPERGERTVAIIGAPSAPGTSVVDTADEAVEQIEPTAALEALSL